MVNAPVLAADGSTAWIIHSVREIAHLEGVRETARLANEAALQAAEARLRSILQTVPDAMIIIDERGRIESLSTTAERLFGYTMAEVVGQERQAAHARRPTASSTTAISSAICATGERRIIGIGRIVVGQRKDGTTFPMHLTVGEMRSAERHYFTGFIRDLTDQQLTESRLQELQSEVTHMSRFTALGEMASTLAHEINQPLTAITNYLKGCQRLLAADRGRAGARAAATRSPRRPTRRCAPARSSAGCASSWRAAKASAGSRTCAKLIEDASTLALVGARENGDRGVVPARSRGRSGAGRPHPDPAGAGQPDPQRHRGHDGVAGRARAGDRDALPDDGDWSR